MRLKRKKEWKNVLQVRENHQVPFFVFPLLEESGLVIQGFSTKMGGVSKGCFSTMNFSYSKGDVAEDVTENYRRMAKALGVDMEKMVLAHQTHTTHVYRVTSDDVGKGILRERDYTDVDGLITNEPGITLVTFFADCVPLYFLDPVNKAIGLSHSGWRGTAKKMGRVTIQAMQEAFGTDPKELLVGIGPSICGACYEVDDQVYMEFEKEFPKEALDHVLKEKEGGKYQLDLWKANEWIFCEAGVEANHIQVTDICTACNGDILFSHRKMGNERGNLAAFLSLKER